MSLDGLIRTSKDFDDKWGIHFSPEIESLVTGNSKVEFVGSNKLVGEEIRSYNGSRAL